MRSASASSKLTGAGSAKRSPPRSLRRSKDGRSSRRWKPRSPRSSRRWKPPRSPPRSSRRSKRRTVVAALVATTVITTVERRTVVAALEATVATVVATLVAATVAAVVTTVEGRTVVTALVAATVTAVVTAVERRTVVTALEATAVDHGRHGAGSRHGRRRGHHDARTTDGRRGAGSRHGRHDAGSRHGRAAVVTTVERRTVVAALEATVIAAVVAAVRGAVLVTRGAPLAAADVGGARRGRAGGLGAGEGTGGLRRPWPRCGFLAAAAFFSVDQRAFLGAPEEVCLGIAYSTLLTRADFASSRESHHDHADEPQAQQCLRPMCTGARHLCRPVFGSAPRRCRAAPSGAIFRWGVTSSDEPARRASPAPSLPS